MKITIILGPFGCIPPYAIGAVEKIWYLIGRQWQKDGHNVYFVSKRPSDIQGDVSNIFIRGYERTGNWYKDLFLDLVYSYKALLKAPSSDAVILNSIWSPIFYPLFKRKLGYSLYNVARFPKRQMGLYRDMNCLSCVSTAVFNALIKQSPSMRPSACIIPNPIDTEVYKSESPHSYSEQPVVIYSGRIHKEKGIELLVEAVNILNISNKVSLRIIGPTDIGRGGSGQEYVDYLNSLAKNFSIEWVEPVYNAVALSVLIREGHIFCYPSLAEFGETFGVAPLEAMGLGLVPVVSDLDCFKDFVNRENGFIFDRNSSDAVNQICESIKQLIENKDLYTKMSAKAINTASKFSVKHIADMYMNKILER